MTFLEDTNIYKNHYLQDIYWPQIFILGVSSKCNYRCIMCPTVLGASPCEVKNQNMTLATLKRLEIPLRHASCAVFAWMGEPLLNSELPGMIRYVKDLGIHAHITTNGSLLDEASCRSILDAGIDSIAISIHAPNKQLYEEIMLGGHFERIKSHITQLNTIIAERPGKKPVVEVATVAMQKNVHALPDMIALLNELNIKKIQIAPADDYGCPEKYAFDRNGTFGDKKRARHYIEQTMALAEKSGIQMDFSDPERMRYELGGTSPEQNYQFQTLYNENEIRESNLGKQCPIPWNHAIISESGDVHACGISKRVLGNINNARFEDIWFGEAFKTFRARLLGSALPGECLDCRRVQWVKSRPLSSVSGKMQVNQKEFHGQGWQNAYHSSSGEAYRHMGKASTFFLYQNRKNMLILELGRIGTQNISGSVFVNDLKVGRYDVDRERQVFRYRIPRHLPCLIKITIVGQPADFKLIFYRAGLIHARSLYVRHFLWEKIASFPGLKAGVQFLKTKRLRRP